LLVAEGAASSLLLTGSLPILKPAAWVLLASLSLPFGKRTLEVEVPLSVGAAGAPWIHLVFACLLSVDQLASSLELTLTGLGQALQLGGLLLLWD